MTERRIAFRSEWLEVRHVPAGDGSRHVVTFESYHDDAGFERDGFGEAFFRHEGISALHVLSAGNDWYQYPEMDAALAAIRAIIGGAGPVMTYGSSMGGYAAIRFADAVGATRVLALSPQYSLDRRVMRVERRWVRDQNRIRFRPDYNRRIRCAADVIVAHDPVVAADVLHADRIARDIPIRQLRLPHSGHPVGPFLQQTGLLQPLVAACFAGDADLARIEADAAVKRETSVTWLIERSSALAEARERAAALDLAQRALALGPGNPTVLHNLGLRLHEMRDYAAAIDTLRTAVSAWPHPVFLRALSRSLLFDGACDEALRIAEELMRIIPDDPANARWMGRVLLHLGDRAGAARHYAAAFRMRWGTGGFFDLFGQGLRSATRS